MNYVLEPLTLEKLKNIFDKKALEIFEFQLKKSVFAQPEIIPGQENYRLQITKEYLEQWCVQAIQATPIGSGSYPVDIIKDNWGADVKAMACSLDSEGNLNDGDTGETSLAQKFQETGDNLDDLFKNKKYDEIKNGWMEIIRKKNQSVITEKNLKNIYYFFFLRGNNNYYLCGVEFFIDRLNIVKVNSKRTTESSVFLENYIDENFGYAKIYKAKKRLELRLKAKNLVNSGYCIKIDIPKSLNPIHLRNENLDEYLEKIVMDFFKK
ncbi:hypothetical protein KAZ01_04185 [Candidatus Gracilibacteria bacterium]|nr:hypothetical protein [Candidatus Gracilibacteria bacterium]